MASQQRFVPMLAYEDGVAAMDWLVRVFGFEERTRWLDDSGKLAHGELALGDHVVMLACPSAEYQSPATVRAHYPPAQRWSEVPYIMNGVLVYVEDVDQAYRRAVVEGAKILSEIEDSAPGRRFRVEDLEGQRWFVFQQ